MLKKIVFLLACFFSISSFSATMACPPATSTNSEGFCSSFKSAALCYCTSTGLPRGMCGKMSQIYSRMIALYGSVQRACEFQHHTSTQTCLDDWKCYRNGGSDSQGRLCSGTGKACE